MSNLRAVIFYPSGCPDDLKHTVRTVLEERHYDLEDWQTDFRSTDRSVLMSIWESVRRADLVVAVLNAPDRPVNANVIYEYGFAQGHCDQRPSCRVLTVLCEVKDGVNGLPDLPFDIHGILHLVWRPQAPSDFKARLAGEVKDRAIEMVSRHEKALHAVHQSAAWLPASWRSTHLAILAEAKALGQRHATHEEAILGATAAVVAFATRLSEAEQSSDAEARDVGAAPTAGALAGEAPLLESFADEAHRGAMERGVVPHQPTEWHALQKRTGERTGSLPALGYRLTQVRHVRRDGRLSGRLLLAGAMRGALWALAFATVLSLFVAKVRADQANRHHREHGLDVVESPVEPRPAPTDGPNGSAAEKDRPAGAKARQCKRQDVWHCLPREIGNAALMLAAVVLIVFAGILWRRNVPNSRLGAVLAVSAGLVGLYFTKSGELEELVRLLRLAAVAVLGCWLIHTAPAPALLNDRGASSLAVRSGLKAAFGTAILSGVLLWFEDIDVGKVDVAQEAFEVHMRPLIVPLLAIKHACTAGLVIHGAVRRLLLPWLWA